MREIRLALLEADVNFKVVKSFTATLRERCLGGEVLESLDPGQQVVKIVNEELTALMGARGAELSLRRERPTVILIAGLQGSGKTTACAKLALATSVSPARTSALVAADVYRPAAIDQLVQLGAQIGVPVYRREATATRSRSPSGRSSALAPRSRDVADRRHRRPPARRRGADGRARRRSATQTEPDDVLLVLDAMTGQEAVEVAEAFAERSTSTAS